MRMNDYGFIFMESAPVVIVLTKYDLLLRMKKTRLRWSNRSLASEALEQRATEEAQKEFQASLQSLTSALGELPHYAKVSGIASHSFFVQC
jgi:hypothetical protein